MSKTDFEAESTIEIFVNLRKDQKQTMVQIQATPSAE